MNDAPVPKRPHSAEARSPRIVPRARLTLRDVADMAGVSQTTASRVLNGRGEVSSEVRSRVESVIAETGYRPSATARSLVSHRTGLIGFVVPLRTSTLVHDSYFAQILQSVSRASARHGIAVALFLLDEESDQGGLIDQVIGPRRVDGMIVSAYHTHDEFLDRLSEFDVSTVTMGPNPYPQLFSSVEVDNEAGGRMAAEHLLAVGCERLALLGGPDDTKSGADRNRGFRAAVEDAGHQLSDRLVRVGDYTESTGERLGAALAEESFDGVFAASDAMALGLMRSLAASGKQVPRDVAVVGFDDLDFAARSVPPLTTIRQPIDGVSEVALDLLLGQIEDPSAVDHVVLPVELVDRRSTQR